jgi:hypothetical protein
MNKEILLEWQVLTKKLEQIKAEKKEIYESQAGWGIHRNPDDPARIRAEEYLQEKHSRLTDRECKIEDRLEGLDKQIENGE